MVDKNGHIVIVGGGIIGCSTAYYLAKAGYSNVTVCEAVHIAHAASGRAGGFLARDWCDSSFTKDLARRSFQLHQDLSNTLEKDIGYRRLETLSMAVVDKKSGKNDCSKAPSWVDGNVQHCQKIGNTESTAQVTPKLLCEALIEEAKLSGVQVKTAEIVGMEISGKDVTALKVKDGSKIECSVVLLSMGPWTGQGLAWMQKPNNLVSGDRAHSILLQPDLSKSSIDNTALFLHYKPNYSGKSLEPEVYPRPDGTVYVCGQGDSEPLPTNPSDVKPDPKSCKTLFNIAAKVSQHLSEAELVAESACYLPCSKDNVPLIGKVPGYENVYIGTGHYCWGILQGPATGEALADFISSGKMPDILKDFDPSRLM